MLNIVDIRQCSAQRYAIVVIDLTPAHFSLPIQDHIKGPSIFDVQNISPLLFALPLGHCLTHATYLLYSYPSHCIRLICMVFYPFRIRFIPLGMHGLRSCVRGSAARNEKTGRGVQ